MFDATGHGNEVVLFHASQALVLQVADWIQKHSEFSLRLVSAKTPVEIDAAMDSAAVAIVDGTEQPDLAVDVLEIAVDRLGRERAAAYTERTNNDLEIQVRVRGSLFLPGPMSSIEWEGFFEPIRTAALAGRWAATEVGTDNAGGLRSIPS